MLCGSAAVAQDSGLKPGPLYGLKKKKELPLGSQTQAIYDKLPPEDQARLIEEATYVYNMCMERPVFNDLHDCSCLAVKAMDVRILDPESPKSIVAIADEVAGDCPDAAGAAGYAYKTCFSNFSNYMPYGSEDYCTCFANNFSKFYMEDPRSYMPHIRRVNRMALSQCKKDGVPTPLDVKPY